MVAKELIITLPNSHLRQKSRKVGLITSEVKHVVEQMITATLEWEASRPHEVGVALAAIQINHAWRIIIIRNNFEDKHDQTFSVFINPEITKLEGEIEEDFEGCLSVSDIYGKVPRYTKVRMRATDENGHQIKLKAEGFLARILQHEVDHVNGVMFVDHIKEKPQNFYKLTPEGKLVKLSYEQVNKDSLLWK